MTSDDPNDPTSSPTSIIQSTPVVHSPPDDSLQNALKESEEQNRLLNIEYGRLLREKEVS